MGKSISQVPIDSRCVRSLWISQLLSLTVITLQLNETAWSLGWCVCLQYIFKATSWAVGKSWRHTSTLPGGTWKVILKATVSVGATRLSNWRGEEGAGWGQHLMCTPFLFSARVGPLHLGQHMHQDNHTKRCQTSKAEAEIRFWSWNGPEQSQVAGYVGKMLMLGMSSVWVLVSKTQ